MGAVIATVNSVGQVGLVLSCNWGELIISKYFQNVNVAIAMAWQCSCLVLSEVTSCQANDQGKNQCRRVEAGETNLFSGACPLSI